MLLHALLLSCIFLASNNPSYTYAANLQAQCSFASTYDTDAYANNVCTFSYSTYYNNDEDYISYLNRIDLQVDLYDSDDDLMQSYSGYYVFAEPVEFDIHNDQISVLYAFDGSDLDYRFTYSNIQYLITIENFYYNASDRVAQPWPSIKFDKVNLTLALRSSLEQMNYNEGYTAGYDDGQADGFTDGRQTGYAEGIQYASQQDQTALTIFTGICNVGLLPVNVFLQMLNFEVFGINIGGFVSALITVAIVVIIIRVVTGKKAND